MKPRSRIGSARPSSSYQPSVAGWGTALGLACLGLLGACQSVEHGTRTKAPALHVEDIVAAAGSSNVLALRELERLDHPTRTPSRDRLAAVRLRLAVLHQRLGDDASANHYLDQVLTGTMNSPNAEAIAWYLQSLGFAAKGERKNELAALAAAHRLAIEPSLKRRIQEAGYPPRKQTPVTRKIPAATSRGIVLVKRAEWGSAAALPSRMTRMGRPDKLTVHHSAMYSAGSYAAQQVRAFQRNHMRDRRWGDIGYHFMIDADGRVFEGRDMRFQGAHAGNTVANRGNIGVCLLGNFEPGGAERVQRPTTEQLRALDYLVRSLRRVHGFSANAIYTHKEVHPRGPAATDCPGQHLTPFVVGLRNRLHLEDIARAK